MVKEDDIDIAQLGPLLVAPCFWEDATEALDCANDAPVVCVAALYYGWTTPLVIAIAWPGTDRSLRIEVRQQFWEWMPFVSIVENELDASGQRPHRVQPCVLLSKRKYGHHLNLAKNRLAPSQQLRTHRRVAVCLQVRVKSSQLEQLVQAWQDSNCACSSTFQCTSLSPTANQRGRRCIDVHVEKFWWRAREKRSSTSMTGERGGRQPCGTGRGGCHAAHLTGSRRRPVAANRSARRQRPRRSAARP